MFEVGQNKRRSKADQQNRQELYFSENSSLSARVVRVHILLTVTCQELLPVTCQDCTPALLHHWYYFITMPGPELQYMLNTYILFCRGDSHLCGLASCAMSGVSKPDANNRQASSIEGPGVEDVAPLENVVSVAKRGTSAHQARPAHADTPGQFKETFRQVRHVGPPSEVPN